MIPRRKIHTIKGEYRLAIKMLLKNNSNLAGCISGWEEEFARYLGVRHALAVGSGRAGMKLILKSLRLKEGDEIIIPAYTLKDLISVIQSLGLKVVVADIDPKTFNIDPDSVAEKITGRTKVILATHIFGSPCRIDSILHLARPSSIFVIEDCAHSLGAEFNDRKTGSFADAAFFSFETIKPVNAYGGGMLVVNNEELFRKAQKDGLCYKNERKTSISKVAMAFLENLLLPTPLSYFPLSLLASRRCNKKIYGFYRRIQELSAQKKPFTDFQAFIGMQKLKSLDKRVAWRQKQASLLKLLLTKEIIPQQIEAQASSNYYFFVALLPFDIWKARMALLRRGIDAGIAAEITDDCASFLGAEDCPNAKKAFQSAIQLPLHEGMDERQIRYVAETMNSII